MDGKLTKIQILVFNQNQIDNFIIKLKAYATFDFCFVRLKSFHWIQRDKFCLIISQVKLNSLSIICYAVNSRYNISVILVMSCHFDRNYTVQNFTTIFNDSSTVHLKITYHLPNIQTEFFSYFKLILLFFFIFLLNSRFSSACGIVELEVSTT